jgi:putative nucleotidyltransferase-like protein
MTDPEHRFSPAEELAIRTLNVDLLTGSVVSSLRRAGIPSILLKGPTVARWLYDEGAVRSYVDTDLLLAPDDLPRAERLLADLGFERDGLGTIPEDWPRHARTWLRPDGANVDLHRTLVGVGVDPSELWTVLSAETETMRVGGVDVDVLRPPARALVVALHAAKDGGRIAKVRHDLGHAIERLPLDLWRDTASLAARLHATAGLAAGLRTTPRGAALAAQLQLPSETAMGVALRAHGSPALAVGIDWLFTTSGMRRKALLVARKLVPPPAFLRAWTPLARRGRLGLAVAYLWRPVWVAWQSGPGLWAWWRARREVARSRSPAQRYSKSS